MWKSAGRAPSLRVFTLAFALQLRKKHEKTTGRVRETSVRLIKTSVIFFFNNNIIYLLTAIGLSPKEERKRRKKQDDGITLQKPRET
jgi:hypothetical protein